MDTADRAENERIRRFVRMTELGTLISDAARRADAVLRLENALRYETWRPATTRR